MSVSCSSFVEQDKKTAATGDRFRWQQDAYVALMTEEKSFGVFGHKGLNFSELRNSHRD
jgi:hypothetical protein